MHLLQVSNNMKVWIYRKKFQKGLKDEDIARGIAYILSRSNNGNLIK